MNIAFLLTEPTPRIVGGYKVVYQYSNYFAEVGHNVTIYYISCPESLRDYALLPMRFAVSKSKIKWFDLNNSIKRVHLVLKRGFKIPVADCYILTASLLVYNLLDYIQPACSIHLIQDYETWATSEKILEYVFSQNINKVVVSSWLKEIVNQFSPVKVEVIKNGINLENFCVVNPIESRKNHTIAMLYHDDERKGVKRGIKALIELKKKYPDLECIMFGSPKRSQQIPDWVDYHRNVPQKELKYIYNQCAIFVCTSYFEGFGLTGLESMASGCALVSTDTKGVKEYAQNNYNALLSNPDDDDALFHNIERVLDDNNYRIALANNAQNSVLNLSLKQSNKRFLEFCVNVVM